MPREHTRIIDYSDMETDRLREIEPDMFDLRQYVDYFSKSWSPKFYPELMLAAQSEETGEYLGLMHIVGILPGSR